MRRLQGKGAAAFGLVALAAVVALAARAGDAPASPVRGSATKAVVNPVYQAVDRVRVHSLAAEHHLGVLGKSRDDEQRREAKEEAGASLTAASRAFRAIPLPLPKIVSSAFSRARVARLTKALAAAQRSLARNKVGAARKAVRDANSAADDLLEYLGLTVVEIKATFTMPVTVYEAVVLDDWYAKTYTWSRTNTCGKFTPVGPIASWSHPDSLLPGGCPLEDVHPGTIEVSVSSGRFTCVGRYEEGSAEGAEDEPAVEPCAAA